MSQFTPPQEGLYWLFLTVVWNGETPAEFSLMGTGSAAPIPKIIRRHTKYRIVDSISRDFVRQLSTSHVLTTATLYGTYGSALLGSSWGGFLLDTIMRPLVS